MIKDVFDSMTEECGVIGICEPGNKDVSHKLFAGLVALQHRGQESVGIAVVDEEMAYYKDNGLVQEVFDQTILDDLKGHTGIGHVRYSTSQFAHVENAQPLVCRHKGDHLALANNGSIVNAQELRDELEENGYIFHTESDGEVIMSLIAKNYAKTNLIDAVINAAGKLKGAFSMVLLTEDNLVAVRDPLGMRPLCIGKTSSGYVVASETVALDVLGASFVRDVQAGELVVIDKNGIQSVIYDKRELKSLCSFEFVYFARPDSVIDGSSVYISRKLAGKILAKEHPAEADVVISVPDSGTAAAMGYAEATGIPFDIGFVKNKYTGRSFIQPSQEMREHAVKLKLNVLKEGVAGKRVVLIDDSIVRGTTIAKLATSLRNAGAKEVHVRVASPPVLGPCVFGIDTPERKKLIAAQHGVEEIREMIGADSLGFISQEGLIESIGMSKDALCTSCFDCKYPDYVNINL